jgi:formamidopyrimidine-DNA glycosylase
MPELPEVETVRAALARCLTGRRIVGVAVGTVALRSPIPRQRLRRRLVGGTVIAARRRAKYLLVDLDNGASLLLHLGMSGSLTLCRASAPRRKHDHVRFRLDGDDELRFNDPRRFGLVAVVEQGGEERHPRLRCLGIEPLSPRFDGPWLWRATRGSRRPIKLWLMDATRLVGVGNIYASEALFAAGISPRRPAGKLSAARCAALAGAVRQTLERAIVEGGTTLRDFFHLDGSTGAFAVRLQVYDRDGEPCRRCVGRVRRIVQSGRSTYYCPGCQR